MRRDDLRVERRIDSDGDTIRAGHRPVIEPEFEALAILWAKKNGFVRRPACGECEGTGIENECRWANEDDGDDCDGCPCPSCGGSGFLPMVALDGINVEALRDALDTDITVTETPDPYGSPVAIADMLADDAWVVWEVARQVLAALDQEDTP